MENLSDNNFHYNINTQSLTFKNMSVALVSDSCISNIQNTILQHDKTFFLLFLTYVLIVYDICFMHIILIVYMCIYISFYV